MSGVYNGVEFFGFEAVVVEILGVKGCDRNFDGDDVCPSSVCDSPVMYDSIFSHFFLSSISVLFCFYLLLSLFVVVVVDIVIVIAIVIIVVVVIVVVVLAALLNLQASALHFCCIG